MQFKNTVVKKHFSSSGFFFFHWSNTTQFVIGKTSAIENIILAVTTELELELTRLRTLKWRKTKHLQVLSVGRMSTWLTHWRNLNTQEAAVDTNSGGFSFQFHSSHHEIADFQDHAFQRTTPEKKPRKSAGFFAKLLLPFLPSILENIGFGKKKLRNVGRGSSVERFTRNPESPFGTETAIRLRSPAFRSDHIL